jgi:hypothetical protein
MVKQALHHPMVMEFQILVVAVVELRQIIKTQAQADQA